MIIPVQRSCKLRKDLTRSKIEFSLLVLGFDSIYAVLPATSVDTAVIAGIDSAEIIPPAESIPAKKILKNAVKPQLAAILVIIALLIIV